MRPNVKTECAPDRVQSGLRHFSVESRSCFNEVLQVRGPNNSQHQAISTNEHTVFMNDTCMSDITWKQIVMFSRAKNQLSIILEAFLLDANELHLHLYGNQHFLILHTWNTEGKSCWIICATAAFASAASVTWATWDSLGSVALISHFAWRWAVSTETPEQTAWIVFTWKETLAVFRPPLVRSVFCLLARNAQQSWFDRTNQQRARATYTECIFWALFNGPRLGNGSGVLPPFTRQLVADHFSKCSVFNLLHWMTLKALTTATSPVTNHAAVLGHLTKKNPNILNLIVFRVNKNWLTNKP